LAGYDFISIHRSYLINLRYVKGLNKQEVTLSDGTILPISRLRFQDVKRAFHDYISKTSI